MGLAEEHSHQGKKRKELFESPSILEKREVLLRPRLGCGTH